MASVGVTDNTYYRWRKEYGGIRTDQAKRLKERENARLKKLVSERFSRVAPAKGPDGPAADPDSQFRLWPAAVL